MLSPVALTVFLLLINHINCYPFNFSSSNNVNDEKLLEFTKYITNLDIENSSNFTPQLMEAYDSFFTWSVFPPVDPEAFMNAKEIIEYHGYPVEEYSIETDDGYILTVQRIPHGKHEAGSTPHQPILLQHGLMATSEIWLCNIPENNLPYILADAGYDVWLSNVRGNGYGYKNTHLSPDQKEFWDFSFDEMARYDIPAIIQKMLNVTGFKQIHYAGHSMGTTILFALLSSQPEYNDIIKEAYLMAPMITLLHATGLITPLAFLYPAIRIPIEFEGGEVDITDKFTSFVAITLCNGPSANICARVVFQLVGVDNTYTNVSRFPVYMNHFPNTTSDRTINHFVQLKKSQSGLKYYDFGSEENLKRYNSTEVPSYNFTKITAPIALISGANDILADPTDVAALKPQLPNVQLAYQVQEYNHFDFTWGTHMKAMLGDNLIGFMKKMWP